MTDIMPFFKKNSEILMAVAVILLGAFLRFWHLDSLPPGLYPDEAINGNDALNLPGQVFYPENNGREGLFHNLLALSFALFGPGIWTLRLVPALMGTLTILGIYLLSKEAGLLAVGKMLNTKYQKLFIQYFPLFAAFLLATSFWHINFSRIGFRAILLPLVLTFCFYFLLKGLRTKTLQDVIVAGLIFGLGFYTYISFRFAIFILPLYLSLI